MLFRSSYAPGSIAHIWCLWGKKWCLGKKVVNWLETILIPVHYICAYVHMLLSLHTHVHVHYVQDAIQPIWECAGAGACQQLRSSPRLVDRKSLQSLRDRAQQKHWSGTSWHVHPCRSQQQVTGCLRMFDICNTACQFVYHKLCFPIPSTLDLDAPHTHVHTMYYVCGGETQEEGSPFSAHACPSLYWKQLSCLTTSACQNRTRQHTISK